MQLFYFHCLKHTHNGKACVGGETREGLWLDKAVKESVVYVLV